MSSKRILRYVATGVVWLLLFGGCAYDRHEECDLTLSDSSFTLHLSRLAEYAEEQSILPEGVIIEGRVVANDSAENFYQCLVLEQDGVGVVLHLGIYDLHALYPVGCGVVADIGGLAVERHEGVLQVGREGFGWSVGVEPVAPRSEVLRRVEVSERVVTVEAQSCTIATLSEEMCGRLVEVRNLCYNGEPTEWAVADNGYYTDRVFEDSEGGRIVVRTSSRADFAAEKIPAEVVTLRGILYCDVVGEDEQEVFVLKLRDRDDVLP